MSETRDPALKPVATWLVICATMVFAMILLGGAVRLTGSGLSMVDWKPILGILPPFNEADWRAAFASYQQFPEFQLVNREMNLVEFKFIYFMEYAHRLLGRLIGLVYIIPFLYFMVLGKISHRLRPHLWLLLAMGTVQGLVGWFMVQSGLVDDPRVSQYRLTVHLMIAVLIYAYMVRILAGWLGPRNPGRSGPGAIGLTMIAVILLMIASGGLVAGTRAGFIFNTFPLMGSHWVPAQLYALQPLWLNFFENPVAIQFVHRVLAAAVTIMVTGFVISNLAFRDRRVPKIWVFTLLAALTVQLILGISTLLLKVPPALGVAHQGGALLVLTVAIIAVFHSRAVGDR